MIRNNISLRRCTVCCAFLLCSVSLPGQSLAQWSVSFSFWYTVDVDDDVLLRVNPLDGTTWEMGPLGQDVHDVDLALAPGGLYAVDNRPGEAAELLWIDRNTGAATPHGTLTYQGQPVPMAEGLAGGDLLTVSFGTTTEANSHILGTLSTADATISDVDVYPSETTDLDGLAGSGSHAIDAGPPSASEGQFVVLSEDSGAFVPPGDPKPGSPNDVVFDGLDGCPSLDLLWLAIQEDGTLYRGNTQDGDLVETVTLDRPGNYHGLGVSTYYFPSDDGFIGGTDLDVVRSFWGQHVTPGNGLHGDHNADGFVGGDDLDLIRTFWGCGTPPSSGGSPVPEPSILVLLIAALLCLSRRRWPSVLD